MAEGRQWRKFPQGKQRLEQRQENARGIKRFIKRFKEDPSSIYGKYQWVDSRLDDASVISGQRSFRKSFLNALPEGTKSLKNYIEETLKEKKGKARYAEFGGISAAISREFTKDFFIQSFGIALFDQRFHDSYKESHVEWMKGRDKAHNHEVIEGNLLEPTTYSILEKKLNGEKLDLILERMGAGFSFAPQDARSVGALLQKWYSFLAPGGLMLIQVPIHFNSLATEWGKYVKEVTKGTLEVRFGRGEYNGGEGENAALLIRKLPGAPDELPMLSSNVIKDMNSNAWREVVDS